MDTFTYAHVYTLTCKGSDGQEEEWSQKLGNGASEGGSPSIEGFGGLGFVDSDTKGWKDDYRSQWLVLSLGITSIAPSPATAQCLHRLVPLWGQQPLM